MDETLPFMNTAGLQTHPDTGTSRSGALERRLSALMLCRAAERHAPAALSTPLGVAVIAFIQWDGPRSAIVPYFVVLLLLVAACNHWAARRIMALRATPDKALKYERRFVIGLGAAGAAWGLVGWMMTSLDLAAWSASDTLSAVILVYVSCLMPIAAAHCPRGLVAHVTMLWLVAMSHSLFQADGLRNGPLVVGAVACLLLTSWIYGRMLVVQTRKGVLAELEREDLSESLRLANRDLEQALHQAVDAANHDPLTNVLNRRALYAHAEYVSADRRRRDRPCAVLLLDLDHFKRINDRHGHAAGDAVLIAVATTLARELREVDLIARWGGEEFLVLLPDCNIESALARAEQLRVEVAALVLGALPVGHRASVSIGVADWPARYTLDETIQRADGALYEAKNAGRDRVVLAAA